MPESTVHRILAAVENLAPAECGAFLVELDDACVGSVFVERNQVCWAAYTGLHRRLRELLRAHLAQHLGKAEAMQRAIRQHTIESLLALPQERGEKVVWVAHQHAGYHPRFTFAPSELLVGVNAFLHASGAAEADAAMARLGSALEVASFVTGDEREPVVVRHAGSRLTIRELDELGAWADAAFGVTRGFSREVLRRAIEAATGELFVAWQTSRRLTHAVVLERGADLDRLVDELGRCDLPTVISRRARRSSTAARDALGSVSKHSITKTVENI